MYCPLDKRKPCPVRLKPTETYLGEDMNGYYIASYQLDGIGDMFKRMTKFTSKSFTPSNIWKGVRNTLLTTSTLGVYQVMPKNVKKTMENIGDIAIPVIAGAAVAYAAGPAIMGSLGPKLTQAATTLGKGIMSVGGSLFEAMNKLPQSQQAVVAQEVTPDDIVYAEQHGGVLPSRIQNLIRTQEAIAYGGAAQYANTSMVLPQPVQPSFYASSSLYPGLQYSAAEAAMQQSRESDREGLSPGETIGIALGGSVLLMLLFRK